LEKNPDQEWVGQSRESLDLVNRSQVFDYLQSEKPDAMIIAAAKVGGISANATYPVDFLTQNIQIQTNLLDAAHSANVERVLFLGSSCVYPKFSSQPIKEEYLLTGELEATNEPYAIAKIAGLKLVEAYRRQFGRKWISAMPTNIYGPGDNFDLNSSHVLPALIRKIHEAKVKGESSITLWGSGLPRREFLHSNDLASASVLLIEKYDHNMPVNIGTGKDTEIRELAELISQVVGYEGTVLWDTSKPDGTPRKLLDISRISNLGWAPSISLREGIESTYRSFLAGTQRI
jgi:GDP-L-fucose synthase